MHDVLAHRLSLLSLHAGALEVHPDAPPEEIARAAAVVRASAHQALEDLREVIDVLRAEPAGGEAQRPQPTLADVADARRGVARRRHRDRVRHSASTPRACRAATGRTVYRIVQEGLTNALKHAPARRCRRRSTARRASGLTVEIVSRRPLAQLGHARSRAPAPGSSGSRSASASRAGASSTAAREAGDYRLWAWLPWPA